MAEMQVKEGGGGKGKPKKMSTRVDLTPMVDLGFLLITFFMLTTTLSKPQIMALVMPDKKVDKEEQDPVKEGKVLTLLLGANDKVYWYEGITKPTLDSTDYAAEGLRKVILNKMDKVLAQYGPDTYKDIKTQEEKKGSFITVIIKPTKVSRYKNLVDALDEMAITHVRYYVILDVSELEEEFIKHPEKGLNFTPEAQSEAATTQ